MYRLTSFTLIPVSENVKFYKRLITVINKFVATFLRYRLFFYIFYITDLDVQITKKPTYSRITLYLPFPTLTQDPGEILVMSLYDNCQTNVTNYVFFTVFGLDSPLGLFPPGMEHKMYPLMDVDHRPPPLDAPLFTNVKKKCMYDYFF